MICGSAAVKTGRVHKYVLALPDSRLRILIATGQFEEVESDDKEVSK
jgi:hypothetical protein